MLDPPGAGVRFAANRILRHFKQQVFFQPFSPFVERRLDPTQGDQVRQACRYLARFYPVTTIHRCTSVSAGTACIICSFVNHFAKHAPNRRSTTPLVFQFAATRAFDFCFQFSIGILQKLLQCVLSDRQQVFTQHHFNIANSNAFRFCLLYRLFNDFRQYFAYLIYLFNVIFHFEPRVVWFGCSLTILPEVPSP
jgi:hypothetical protein